MQVDALREHVLVRVAYAGQRVVRVDEGTAGVDEDPGADDHRPARRSCRAPRRPRRSPSRRAAERLDIVGGDAALVERAPDEVPHEAGVVVVQVGVGVLEAAVGSGEVSTIGSSRAMRARREERAASG